MINKKLVDEIMSQNNQKPLRPEDSELWKSIMQGFGCTAEEAQSFALYHCNSLSFYTLCRARGFIEFYYSTWCELLLKNGLITKRGYIGDNKHNKLDVAKLFGFEKEFGKLVYFDNYEDVMSGKCLNPEKGYNIKVHSNSKDGDHFMSSYVDKVLIVSDSMRRGIHKRARDVIPKEKFQWALEV